MARYRARGQLTEVRAADLRFTPAEAAQFLNQSMGLSLSEEEVVALEARTEGWIAGLQMAALALQEIALQGQEDTAQFIKPLPAATVLCSTIWSKKCCNVSPTTCVTFCYKPLF
ncbi:MAG: hypothetical protein R2911_07445 [Caldilineaceae bacterium]